MPLGDSVWFPQSPKRAGVLAIVIAMVILHQSELFGLMDAGLLFGWVPVQLAYDIVYLLVGVIILYWIATTIPATSDYPSTSHSHGSTTTDPVDAKER